MKMPPKDKTPKKPRSKHYPDVYQVSHKDSLNDKPVLLRTSSQKCALPFFLFPSLF